MALSSVVYYQGFIVRSPGSCVIVLYMQPSPPSLVRQYCVRERDPIFCIPSTEISLNIVKDSFQCCLRSDIEKVGNASVDTSNRQ